MRNKILKITIVFVKIKQKIVLKITKHFDTLKKPGETKKKPGETTLILPNYDDIF